MENQHKSSKGHNNNSIMTGIMIGVLTCLFITTFFLVINHIVHPSSLGVFDTNKLAVEVNAVNNILTWGSFIVAVLSIFAAIFGIAGFIQFKSSINQKLGESKKDATRLQTVTSKQITDIKNGTKEDIKKAKRSIERFQKEISKRFVEITGKNEIDIKSSIHSIEQFQREISQQIVDIKKKNKIEINQIKQNSDLRLKDCDSRIRSIENQFKSFHSRIAAEARYIEESNNYIFESISLITEQIGGVTAKGILENQLHRIQVIRLYHIYPNNDTNKAIIIKEKKSALLYLFFNGTMDDIPDLEYVEQYDPIDEIRHEATKVIGAIRYHNRNS